MAIARKPVVGGLLAAASAVALLWAAGAEFRFIIPPGLLVLPAAAGVAAFARGRWAAGLAAVVALYALTTLLLRDGLAALAGAAGAAIALGRWLQVAGLGVALIASGSELLRAWRSRADTASAAVLTEAGVGRRWWQVALLLVLAPVCAEYVAAYDDSTGDPRRLAEGLLIFVPLYGAPALLIRELARRAGLSWAGLILLAAAFGVLQAGVVDQSLFSLGYRGLEGWEEGRRIAYIAPLGVSAHQVIAFVVGHVIYSICAPIALVEALQPETRREPWLGKIGLAVTTSLYAVASWLVLRDHLATEASHASSAQVAGAVLVAAALVAAGFVVGKRPRTATDRRAPSTAVVFASSLLGATVLAVLPETDVGTLAETAVLAAAAALLFRVARSREWGLPHEASVASGALLSRALLAFTYFPLVGEVAPVPKYAHNASLLAVLLAVSYIAARRAATRPTHEPRHPP